MSLISSHGDYLLLGLLLVTLSGPLGRCLSWMTTGMAVRALAKTLLVTMLVLPLLPGVRRALDDRVHQASYQMVTAAERLLHRIGPVQ